MIRIRMRLHSCCVRAVPCSTDFSPQALFRLKHLRAAVLTFHRILSIACPYSFVQPVFHYSEILFESASELLIFGSDWVASNYFWLAINDGSFLLFNLKISFESFNCSILEDSVNWFGSIGKITSANCRFRSHQFTWLVESETMFTSIRRAITSA